MIKLGLAEDYCRELLTLSLSYLTQNDQNMVFDTVIR